MKLKTLFFVSVFVILGISPGVSQCVDFDGDGRADSCGSVGNVPMPTGIERVDTGGSYSRTSGSSQQEAAPTPRTVHRSTGPSMDTMIATTVFGSLLEAVFMEPAPPPGPTPEQIEAERKLAEQKRLEFERSNRALARQLKGATYAEDKNVAEVGGLKLKTLPPVKPSSGEVHRGFFGSEGSANPTVGLLREDMDAEWFKGEQGLIEQRMESPNKWAGAITQSLKTQAPPLPYKKFDELEPGDVLLVKASGLSKAINATDNLLSGGSSSDASHTVLYLREVDGVKHFLENVPGQGPRIISGQDVIREYSTRGADVAKLAQPLNPTEAKALYSAAVDMAAKNRNDIVGSRFLGTNYGAWGKDDVVCSEADWALLNMARKDAVPATANRIKSGLGVDFSPADFYDNGQYFLVSPLEMPSK